MLIYPDLMTKILSKYPDPLVEIIYHVSYCLVKTDSSLREDILNDTLGLLYFAKSLIDTVHDIKRGEPNSLSVLISASADLSLSLPASDCFFFAFLAIIGSSFNASTALW